MLHDDDLARLLACAETVGGPLGHLFQLVTYLPILVASIRREREMLTTLAEAMLDEDPRRLELARMIADYMHGLGAAGVPESDLDTEEP